MGIGDIHYVITINEDAARSAELLPLREKFSVLVEDPDAAVAAIAEDAYARSIKSISPDELRKESAIKTQLGLIKQITGKDVKVEQVIDFTLLRQVLAETK